MTTNKSLGGRGYHLPPDSKIYIDCANNVFENIYNDFDCFGKSKFLQLFTKQLSDFYSDHKRELEAKDAANWLFKEGYLVKDEAGLFARSAKLIKAVVLPYGCLYVKPIKPIIKNECKA